ncbi:GntR family transcriptional regulator [Pseudovibrio exalbescens]|uniref:GntR family transcriptional regulator n=1 Tax=Pseudovibrio exalbescens TaxID=197461 RepID=UPI000C9A99D7|nr:GntR family transcriptional regulator [Pseudovibrio exalbescens]
MPAISSNVGLAYVRLKEAILSGKLPPDTRLLEQQAADYLSMSRTPVREAMLLLEKDGLVHLKPRHGMEVLRFGREDIRQIYEIVAALEPLASRQLADRRPNLADLKPLQDAMEMMSIAQRQRQNAVWAAADRKFHQQILFLSGYDRMYPILDQLWDQTYRARMCLLERTEDNQSATHEHKDLYEAIQFGQGELAYARHKMHLENESARLLAAYDDMHRAQQPAE